MSTILTRIFLSTLAVLLLASPLWAAETDELILFKLELAGYRLGMDYDDAIFVRPVFFVQDTGPAPPENEEIYVNARAEQVYVNDLLMDIWLRFKHEKLYKILVRFSPDQLKDFKKVFNRTLGKGEDQSKSHPDKDGNMIHQNVYFWDYPTAKLYLTRTSGNDEFATVGLIAKPSFADTFADSE